MRAKYRTIMQVISGTVVCGALTLMGESNPYRGLWVGQAKLNFVNEVAVGFDQNNVAVAPDPGRPTPTADQAQIRLILHVNGAGQVTLLKDVAVLRRTAAGETNRWFGSEADYALVTDERRYSDFPVQQARRIASAVFDFGDIHATEAVDGLVLEVSAAVAASVTTTIDVLTARSAATAAAANVVANSDVAETFDQFLKTKLPQSTVSAIALSLNPAADIALLRGDAQSLAECSCYHDTRPVDVLDALEAALATATGDAEKIVAAQGAVARYADVDNLYARYVSGRVFGDMIREVALSAAQEAAKPGATRALINSAVRQTSAYNQASVDASNAKVAAYTDTASASALQVVVAAIVDGALAASAAPPVLFEPLAAELEQRGFAAAGTLQQAIVHLDTPSSDYTDFVRSAEFAGALAVAADAAAKAAVAETRLDPFYTESSLKGAARIGAATALHAVYASAARARQTELPLAGVFALGAGDARLSALIGQAEPPLGAAALTGKIILPANHPTNPFRHRRHPDHTSGFNLERCLRFDFDGLSTNVLERSGLGVERITGIYREEVLGLHKPLGPQPATNPIGLKVEGTFELNRISLIDTLNAR